MTDDIFKLITVYDEANDSIVIEWDHEDPRAISLGINDWTNEKWLKELQAAVDREELEALDNPSN